MGNNIYCKVLKKVVVGQGGRYVEDNGAKLATFKLARYRIKTCLGRQTDRGIVMGRWNKKTHCFHSNLCSRVLKEEEILGGVISINQSINQPIKFI